MSVFNNVARNTLFQGLGRIGSILITIIGVTPLLTSHLSRTEYGEYIFISALVLLFGTTSDWGTNVISVREATQNVAKQPVIFGSSTLFRFILAIISVVAVNILVYLVPGWSQLSTVIAIGSLVLLALSFKTSMSIIFNSLFRLDLSSLVDFTSSLFFFLFLLVVSLFSLTLPTIMWAWFTATLFSGMVAYFLARRVSPIVWRIDFKIVRRIFWEAAPTGSLLLVFSLYNRLDVVILQYFKGSETVASYGFAYKMHENIVLVAAFLMTSLFPHFAHLFKNSRKDLQHYYQRALDILFVVALFQIVFVFVFAPLVVSVLGSGKFSDSTDLWKILSVATFASYFNHLTGYSLIAFGKQRISLVIALVALVLNVVANLVFVPMFSSTASAYITVATEVLVLIISLIVVGKVIGRFPSLTSFPQTLQYLLREIRNGK